jgi:hypothetical protein
VPGGADGEDVIMPGPYPRQFREDVVAVARRRVSGVTIKQIDTPVGPYNPDRAIIKQEDGEDRIYMIRETKSTLDDSKLRPTERDKIKSAKRHFEAIGIDDYARAVPGAWKL